MPRYNIEVEMTEEEHDLYILGQEIAKVEAELHELRRRREAKIKDLVQKADGKLGYKSRVGQLAGITHVRVSQIINGE